MKTKSYKNKITILSLGLISIILLFVPVIVYYTTIANRVNVQQVVNNAYEQVQSNPQYKYVSYYIVDNESNMITLNLTNNKWTYPQNGTSIKIYNTTYKVESINNSSTPIQINENESINNEIIFLNQSEVNNTYSYSNTFYLSNNITINLNNVIIIGYPTLIINGNVVLNMTGNSSIHINNDIQVSDPTDTSITMNFTNTYSLTIKDGYPESDIGTWITSYNDTYNPGVNITYNNCFIG